MGLFKKLFGNSDRSQGDHKKPDLDALLSSDDVNNAIIELDDYICKLCSWGDDLTRLTEPQKNFFLNQNLEREINNGGFNQFFYNSSGDYTHETVASLQAIGASKTANILSQAIEQFPGASVPKDKATRQNILDQIEERAEEIWDQLDKKFFAYDDDLSELNLEYIKQHRSSFE